MLNYLFYNSKDILGKVVRNPDLESISQLACVEVERQQASSEFSSCIRSRNIHFASAK